MASQTVQLKLFIVPVKNLAESEAEMNAFLRGHRVLAVKKEFVADGENSFWTFCVEHLQGAASPSALPGRGPKVDYREVLNESDFALFSKLREWRNNNYGVRVVLAPAHPRGQPAAGLNRTPSRPPWSLAATPASRQQRPQVRPVPVAPSKTPGGRSLAA